MGWNDQLPEDEDFKNFLSELVARQHLDDAALGITKLVIAKGTGVLSPKQLYVFNEHVIGKYTRNGCSRCSSDIPWSEMSHALDNGGLCNYCWNMTERSKED